MTEQIKELERRMAAATHSLQLIAKVLSRLNKRTKDLEQALSATGVHVLDIEVVEKPWNN